MGILKKLFRRKIETPHADKRTFVYSVSIGNMTITINKTEEELVREYEQLLINEANPDSCEKEPNDDEIKLHLSDYDKKLLHGCTWAFGTNEVGSRITTAFINAKANGFRYVVISKSDFELISKKDDEWVERERKLSKTVELNQTGKRLEKEGKINEAIQCYEENIKLGYPAMHSYDRLVVLYHRIKDYENEKRMCLSIQNVFGKENDIRLRRAVSREENKDLIDLIMEAHKDNKPLFVEGRKLVVYNPYATKKYQMRYEKLKSNK
jgi:hypothetical protein